MRLWNTQQLGNVESDSNTGIRLPCRDIFYFASKPYGVGS